MVCPCPCVCVGPLRFCAFIYVLIQYLHNGLYHHHHHHHQHRHHGHRRAYRATNTILWSARLHIAAKPNTECVYVNERVRKMRESFAANVLNYLNDTFVLFNKIFTSGSLFRPPRSSLLCSLLSPISDCAHMMACEWVICLSVYLFNSRFFLGLSLLLLF